jgi:histidine ammonia-lyase
MAKVDPSSQAAPVAVGRPIGIVDLWQIAHRERRCALDGDAAARIDASRRAVESVMRQGDAAPPIYGVNTGFGALAETHIATADIAQLQRNLVRSHACGVGPDLPNEAVRAMMVLRAQVIAYGYSGVRRQLVELLVAMLNADVCPRVPAQGSVGASGDLAPLAHLALALIGEGEARYQGELLPAAEALARAGLEPVVLEAKEGLALINGTQYMTALGALALRRAAELCTAADIAGATCIEALKGSKRPFEERLMVVRPHPGQARVAANLRALLAESEIMESHVGCGKVQDPYSLRCMPQVHGATRDALAWAEEVVERELNSVTDNPTVFLGAGEPEFVSGGNFHGQPVALALDLAALAVAELANISERRVEQLVNPALSTGLPPFLARDSGLCSGFMIAQVASASLVSENKILCHPASVDSIPSSANREDHVSMGSIAARKLVQVVDNVSSSLAIELMAAVEGVDLRAPLVPAAGVAAAQRAVRSVAAAVIEDRPLYPDFARVRDLIESGDLRRQVEAAVGPLH